MATTSSARHTEDPADELRMPWWLWWLPVVAAGAIPLALAWASAVDTRYPIAPDTASYAVPGSSFWKGEGYGVKDAAGRFVPEIARTPGYSLLSLLWTL